MTDRALHLCLPHPMRRDAEAGRVGIVTRIAEAIRPHGWRLALHTDWPLTRARLRGRYVLHHMRDPAGPRELCLRRAHLYPFWRIETSNCRWLWDVAQTPFGPSAVNPVAAEDFRQRWKRQLLGAEPPGREGFLFLPLQGHLSHRRSFQAASPLEMIEQTLDHVPGKPLLATLHPKERYSRAEIAALDRMAARHPRFRLVTDRAEDLLRHCDGVVTQNSAVALTGFFAQKPAVLFAEIDFHHIAGSVPREGPERAFARLDEAPDHAGYLFWFFRHHAINGGSGDAAEQIAARLRAHGWPM
jgi:hypothetical protein